MIPARHLLCVLAAGLALAAPAAAQDLDRPAAEAQLKRGNWKLAHDAFKKLALDPANAGEQLAEDTEKGFLALQRLRRMHELEPFLEEVIAAHPKDWRLLYKAGILVHSRLPHWGYLISGEFRRGPHRGGGRYANPYERDRVRALQLLREALKFGGDEPKKAELAQFCLKFAEILSGGRGYNQSWRFQMLTDLETLPDINATGYNRSGTRGAPVTEDGEPVVYELPASFEKAKNDGERWRHLLLQAAEYDKSLAPEVLLRRASFALSQFGVQTMARYGGFSSAGQDQDKDEAGPFAVSSLKDDETIARLATGARRFKFPEGHNPIALLKEAAQGPRKREAARSLASIYQNRRQYVAAAKWWGEAGDSRMVKQITGNWCRFEPVQSQAAGEGARLGFKFRNAKKVSFKATRIKLDALIADLKTYLKSKPKQLNWNRLNISNLGYRIISQKQSQYLGDEVAQWSQELKPYEKHYDRRIEVTAPLDQGGAYLVEGRVEGGNRSQIVVWVQDMVLARKRVSNGLLYYLADARTGAPVAGAEVEFIGYRQQWKRKPQGRGGYYELQVAEASQSSDAEGLVITKPDTLERGLQWLAVARTKDGRQAHLGFDSVWYSRYQNPTYSQVRGYFLSDRPVYRPGHEVQFKFWIRQARYDSQKVASYAKRRFTVIVTDPKGNKVYEKNLTSDEFGGLSDKLTLAKDATLGAYSIRVNGMNAYGQFRVEEYKKPEFSVKVEAPSEPIALGETFKAKVVAKYYFGAPVTKARVKLRVQRFSTTVSWYPSGPWDWLYGNGYGWFCEDYQWYPGWRRWGCVAPRPWWVRWSPNPPELVLEKEAAIGPDGTLEVEIDSAFAKALHGDQDHRYQVTAEVVDESRRTIVGNGSVLAARKPFNVYGWLDRGYAEVGDAILAQFKARTPDGKPVQGEGLIRLLKISYDKDGKAKEDEVQRWEQSPNDQGLARLPFKASQPGQYRLAYKVTTKKGLSEEGAIIFLVRGQGFDGARFRFNDLELVPDKRTYKVGETAKLSLNTNQPDATVLLFFRPVSGLYQKPTLIKMKGKSQVVEMAITQADYPNVFVEALTISRGKVFTQLKELLVPPQKRILDVTVEPSSAEYKPGEKASVKVTAKTLDGQPFKGALTLRVYDKALDYIAGGAGTADIKSFFWKWRRQHYPQTGSSAGRGSSAVDRPGEEAMRRLGVFGDLDQGAVADAMGGAPQGQSLRKESARAGRSRLAPSSNAAPERKAKRELAESDGYSDDEAAPEAPAEAETKVRTNFADTAYWNAELVTDAEGQATVEFTMPENLSGWSIGAWILGQGTRVGHAQAEVVTRKKVLLRMQAPRFFVEKDEVILSANILNDFDEPQSLRAVLELGSCLALVDGEKGESRFELGAHEERRVDWRVKVLREGEAVIRMKAMAQAESDAMEMRFPVKVHGMAKLIARSGALGRDKTAASVTLTVPEQRRVNSTRLEVRYSPSLAAAMIEALPYLSDYPYGCTEQTLNRFLPTVITQKVLMGMDLDLKAIGAARNNLNAQELGDPKERKGRWAATGFNPVFDEGLVKDMARAGIERLVDMQCSDGGWGWFSGYGEHSSPHTTATVVRGLLVARDNDVAIPQGVLERGIAWLKNYQEQQVALLKVGELSDKERKGRRYKTRAGEMDAYNFMILTEAKVENAAMLAYLDRDRTKLAVYAKALFGLALHKLGEKDKLEVVLENIEQFLVTDKENQTAYLELNNEGSWWYWYGSEYEAQAAYLKLLARTDPKGEKASGLAKYLVNNRKNATYWKSTRDTALCVEALADYLQASKELAPDMTLGIYVDGKKHKEVAINKENLFSFDDRLVLEGDALSSGEHTVEIRREKGAGPVYFNAYLSVFSLEDFLKKEGLEVKVTRQVYKLVRDDKEGAVAGARGQVVKQREMKYKRVLLANEAELKSGDLVEVELSIESKNDYEYLVFEDLKAAGFEAVKVRSGYNGNSLGAYMELRDDRVSFFIKRLARGKHSVSYRLRAEIPGRFSALPARAEAMYAPELKANSDEIKLRIKD